MPDDCPLTKVHSCGLKSEGCEFKHTCQAMLEDENRMLMSQLSDAAESLVGATGGEWAIAEERYVNLMNECIKRGLL